MCDACGQIESVKQFILDCRKWKAKRKGLRDAIISDKSKWGDLPLLTGRMVREPKIRGEN